MKQLTLTFTKNDGQAVIKTEKTFAVNDDQSFHRAPLLEEFTKFLAVLTIDGDVAAPEQIPAEEPKATE